MMQQSMMMQQQPVPVAAPEPVPVPAPEPAPVEEAEPEKEKPLIIGNTYRFHSHNYQHNCLRHKDYRMWAEDENRSGDKD